jgi:integrase
MLSSERPKVSLAKRLPIFTPEQIEQTIAAATEPYRTLSTVAALTGARISELCGLMWADVRVDDLDDAEISSASRSTVAQPSTDQDRWLRANRADPP